MRSIKIFWEEDGKTFVGKMIGSSRTIFSRKLKLIVLCDDNKIRLVNYDKVEASEMIAEKK